MFEAMLDQVREEVTTVLSRIEAPSSDPNPEVIQRPQPRLRESREDPALKGNGTAKGKADGNLNELQHQPVMSRQAASDLNPADPATWGRVPRNATCPCQSGKKYKHCHGRLA